VARASVNKAEAQAAAVLKPQLPTTCNVTWCGTHCIPNALLVSGFCPTKHHWALNHVVTLLNEFEVGECSTKNSHIYCSPCRLPYVYVSESPLRVNENEVDTPVITKKSTKNIHSAPICPAV
jgi:hypothetical protein